MELITPYIDAFTHHIDNYITTQPQQSLYEPIKYLLDIGGKRIRPALSLMAYDLYHDDLDPVMPVAKAVELFHNFSLMHDDIMDMADLRRGQATVHKQYDTNSAILSGDMMLILAYRCLEDLPADIQPRAYQIFSKMAGEVCLGQRMDMDFESTNEVNITDYIQMIAYKTSVLLAASLELGGLVAKAPEMDLQHLYEFGKNIGIAFQIQDDILDTYGSEEVGKKVGGDIIQNKKTYLYLKSMELASQTQQARLVELYNSTPIDAISKISEVKAIFDSCVVKEYALQLMEAYRDLAISHMMQVGVPDESKKSMITLADYLIMRNH